MVPPCCEHGTETESSSGAHTASRRCGMLRFLHRWYKRILSPAFGNVCRFTPCCSDYALEAVETHGYIRGGYLALRRVMRCHPLSPGGNDPVPASRLRTADSVKRAIN